MAKVNNGYQPKIEHGKANSMCTSWTNIVKNEVARIQYKGNADIWAEETGEYYSDGHPELKVVICLNCADARNPGKEFRLTREYVLPLSLLSKWDSSRKGWSDNRANTLRDFVHDRIIDIEMHEVDEWFKVDGVLAFDPHAEEVNAS